MAQSSPDFVARALQAVAALPEEERLRHALQAVQSGECKSMRQAAHDWQVCRQKLQRRAKGGHSYAENGGNRTKLTTVEELALFACVNTQLTIGIAVAIEFLVFN